MRRLSKPIVDAADRLASRGYAFSRFDLVKSTLATENFEQAGLVLALIWRSGHLSSRISRSSALL